ncbi:MAG: hypothetical protein ACJ797_08185 [Ktedonobacteraceae bacterium]
MHGAHTAAGLDGPLPPHLAERTMVEARSTTCVQRMLLPSTGEEKTIGRT